MKTKIQGRVRHCFFGEYSALIGLHFESAEARRQVLNHLGFAPSQYLSAGGGHVISERWHEFEHEGKAYANVQLADPQLTEMVQKFVSLGAEEKKILSMAKSIDYGDPFSFEMEMEDPNQLEFEDMET